MAFVGNIEKNDLEKYIRPMYENFMDMQYDITIAKDMLMKFIVEYCKTERVPEPPKKASGYDIRRFSKYGLFMTIHNEFKIKYIFCVKSGNVFVVENEAECLTTINPDIEFNSQMMYEINSYGVLNTKLLYPKSVQKK